MLHDFINARLALAVALSCAIASAARSAPRSQLQRDVEGYVVATCLTLQESDVLKDQGDGWASIIVQRGFGNVEDWQPLIDAVTAAVKSKPVAVIKGDGVTSKQMPIFYCAEIIDQPEVRAEIERTMEKMKPAYHGR
ncbi:hypothetical protein [uncultured Agrobacterium sp.]|uniref:hypothetical protein n=1 Tax=uncultured Agrobacterium sp. TaxID=157277 RepID=UPI002584C3BA|nr:hypothetical protein [uncultured Agrobacterium sp.]